jgi:hypothetical protein
MNIYVITEVIKKTLFDLIAALALLVFLNTEVGPCLSMIQDGLSRTAGTVPSRPIRAFITLPLFQSLLRLRP